MDVLQNLLLNAGGVGSVEKAEPLHAPVEWNGVSLPTLISLVLAWELFYQCSGMFINKKFAGDFASKKMKLYGCSYATAMMNAVICTLFGAWGFIWLWDAPERVKSVMASSPQDPWWNPRQRYPAYSFLAWLIVDGCHVLLNFGPKKLGGLDVIVHHLLFLSLVVCNIGYGVGPFVSSWLFCGELSSIPLNMRFFLVNTGRGSTPAMMTTNNAFAVTFFMMRVVLYWYGVLDFLNYAPSQMIAQGCDRLLVASVTLAINAGAGLNFYWFIQILKIATGGGCPSSGKSD